MSERSVESADQSTSRRVRVLLVDDDVDCRIIFGAMLRSARFDVDVADNGLSGLARVRERAPDVALIDIAMPVLDGRNLLRLLKSDSSTRDIPTIAVTAAESLHNCGELERVGFDAVLLKPVEPKIVVTAVRQILSSKENRSHG